MINLANIILRDLRREASAERLAHRVKKAPRVIHVGRSRVNESSRPNGRSA